MNESVPTPERIVRNRTPIPQRPTDDDIRGIIGEISRQRGFDRELEIVLQHMVRAFFDRFDDIWTALEILDKRFAEFEQKESELDTVFTEFNRKTQRRERTVVDNDSDIEIDVLDLISPEIQLRGNKTGLIIKFLFNEPLP